MGDRYDAMRLIDAKIEEAKRLLQEAKDIATDHGVNFTLDLGGGNLPLPFNGEIGAVYGRTSGLYNSYWQGSGEGPSC